MSRIGMPKNARSSLSPSAAARRTHRSLRLLVMLLCFGLAGAALSSCGDDEASDAGASAPHSIAYFSPIQANSFVQALGDGVEAEAAAAGAELTVLDANGDAGTQVAQIQNAIASGKHQGFVVVPLGPAVVPALQRAAREDIEIVCATSICGAPPTATSNVLPDIVTTQLGESIPDEQRFLADAVDDACQGVHPCQVAFIPDFAGDPRSVERRKRFAEYVKAQANVELVASQQSGNNNVADSLKVASDLLTAHPNLSVIACSDQCARGAEAALKKAGKLGDVKIVGGGGSTYAVEAVRSGRWFAVAFPQTPNTWGRQATRALVQALNGEMPPKYIDGTPRSPGVLTSENADEFEPEWSGD